MAEGEKVPMPKSGCLGEGGKGRGDGEKRLHGGWTRGVDDTAGRGGGGAASAGAATARRNGNGTRERRRHGLSRSVGGEGPVPPRAGRLVAREPGLPDLPETAQRPDKDGTA